MSDIEAFQVFLNQELVGETPRSDLFFSVYNLTSNTAYSLQVRAAFIPSSTADELQSAIVTESTGNLSLPGNPEPPIRLGLGGGFIRVRAQLPFDSGGAGLATITVEARSSVDNSVVKVIQPASSPEFVLFGLNASTWYLVTAFATNGGGLDGPKSPVLNTATTALEAPGPCPPPTVLRVTGVWRYVQSVAGCRALTMRFRSLTRFFLRRIDHSQTEPACRRRYAALLLPLRCEMMFSLSNEWGLL